MFLDESMEYNMDGDVVDSRTTLIQRLKRKIGLQDAKVKRDKADEQIRNTNPGVKDAWEKYQTLLTLTRVNE